MNEDRETVCAIVVTYNRKKLLLECLEAIRRQTRPVQGIYIIDNASTDGTPEFLKENGYINELPPENLAKPWEREFTIENLVDGKEIRVYYVRMHENTGGAGGFHEGVKRAYEKGYDWLWLMDDDVEPLPDGLHKQLSYKHLGLCMHPTKVTIDGEIFPFEGILDIATGFVYLQEKRRF
ncbi:MAG: glycosyltransferase [Geminocystis sp.]|nr:glycosyltransferase [Geminocystis sp.]